MSTEEKAIFKKAMENMDAKHSFEILTNSESFLSQLSYYESLTGIRFIQSLENYVRRESIEKKFKVKGNESEPIKL